MKMPEPSGLNPHRYVITGGPSVGKQPVLDVLQKWGYPCTKGEPAREIYRSFKERLGRHLKVGDRREYSAEVLRAFISEYCDHKSGVYFYNRGIPDGFGWDRFFGLGPSPDLDSAARTYRYDKVLILDPLDAFQDELDVVWAKDRELRRVHELIIQGYYDAGYEPVFVPADAPEIRAEFILSNISRKPE
jgi:predicted ATPase